MIPSPSLLRRAPCNDGLISRYEQLREQAPGRRTGIARGQGLVLLMRSGMSAWMRAWAQCTVQAPVPAPVVSGNEAILPLEMHKEVAMILAGMVLYGRQEAMA